VEIVGTFINGSLDGNVKLIMESRIQLIGFYKRGLENGLRRIWDEKGKLIFAGFYRDGVRIGKCWYSFLQSVPGIMNFINY
jgi:antitoxin component YwqK of YwqJK toxin-antitoxin module